MSKVIQQNYLYTTFGHRKLLRSVRFYFFLFAELCVDEDDIATYTIKAVDDPRTLNKSLKMRPPDNILTLNELVSLWERKIGNTLERVYTSEDQILKKIQGKHEQILLVNSQLLANDELVSVRQYSLKKKKILAESPYRVSLILSVCHTMFVKGDDSIFETEPSSCVDATELYPEVKYTTVDEYLDRYVQNPRRWIVLTAKSFCYIDHHLFPKCFANDQ